METKTNCIIHHQDYNFQNSSSNTNVNAQFIHYNEKYTNEFEFHNELYYNNENERFIQLGLNLNAMKNRNPNYNLNFSLYNAYGLLSFNSRSKYLFICDILDLKSDIIYNRDWHWLDLGFGYGFDFLGTLEKRLIPIIYGKIGYTSVKPEANLFNNIIKIYDKTFSNFELNGGIKFEYLINPIELELNADYRKITNIPNIDIVSISSKFSFLYYEIKQFISIDYGPLGVARHFNIYLLAEYNKIFVSNLSQSAFNLGLGLDYYFK